MFKLLCYVREDDYNQAFPVRIEEDEDVGTLRKSIKEENRPKFDHIPAHSLVLWRVSVPFDQNLKENVEALNLVSNDKLQTVDIISDLFPSGPQEKTVHVVVDRPHSVISPSRFLQLFCYVRDDDSKQAFLLEIKENAVVSTLRKSIKEEKRPKFDHIPADSLVLWNVHTPLDEHLKETVDKLGLIDENSLSPGIRMSEIFPEQPEDGRIHIVVKNFPIETSSRVHSLLTSGKSGSHESTAIENAWKMAFQGDGAALFKSALDQMNEKRDSKLYANFVPIVQSSGMGKSRLVDETAKLIFTVPFCFRSELDGYPEADEAPSKFFLLRTEETFNDMFDRSLLFLENLFSIVNREVQKLPIEADSLPLQWYKYLIQDGNRLRIYKEVVDTTEKGINDERKPYRPEDPTPEKSRVFVAAQTLIGTIESRVKEDPSEKQTRPVRLLVYIDETHEMTTDKQTFKGDNGRNAYQALCSSLNQLLRLNVFFVFLSTNSTLSDYSPSTRVFWSKRGQDLSITHVQTPYTELPFDVWKEPHLVSEGQHMMDDVCSVGFMVRFGRPLWWTRWEAGDMLIKNNLIDFAMVKLAARNPKEHTKTSYLAALSVRLLLDFEPRRVAAIENENLMVAGHLRVANVIPSHREYIISSLIEKGQRGELVARLLLTLAHDAAVEQMDVKRRENQAQFEKLFTTPVPLHAFFSALFTETHIKSILECRPDHQPTGPTFEETFEDAYVMFTHFGKAADDWCNSDAFAFMALCRNMAISCREGMKFADLCIPIHFGRNTPLSRDATSAIFVSIKDKETAMGYNRTHIDVDKMKFFTDGNKGRPVINLILQLGVQAAGRYIPVERTKKQTEPGLLATPERKSHGGLKAPQTPTGVSLSGPRSADEPKTRSKGKTSGRTCYYTIDARGCSSSIYGVVRPNDEPRLHDLLASKDFLSEHSRQGTAHLRAVLAQKPVWTRGQECCSWAKLSDPPPLDPEPTMHETSGDNLVLMYVDAIFWQTSEAAFGLIGG
ncbi:hypothetical protein JOM56_009496 [Amanita muscaria]